MATRRYEVHPPSTVRFLCALGALVPAGIMFYLIFGGMTYSATNGSSIGMIATMVMMFTALTLTLVGLVLLAMGLVRRHEEAIEYVPTRLDDEKTHRSKSRNAA